MRGYMLRSACPKLTLKPEHVQNTIERGQRRIAACRKRSVERFSIHPGSRRDLAEFVNFRNVAQGQQEYLMGLPTCRVQVGSGILGVSETLVETNLVWL